MAVKAEGFSNGPRLTGLSGLYIGGIEETGPLKVLSQVIATRICPTDGWPLLYVTPTTRPEQDKVNVTIFLAYPKGMVFMFYASYVGDVEKTAYLLGFSVG